MSLRGEVYTHATNLTSPRFFLLKCLYVRVPLVKQELLTHLEHLRSPWFLVGVRVTRSLVLYVRFVDRCLFFCTFFSFGHCVVCSTIYGF